MQFMERLAFLNLKAYHLSHLISIKALYRPPRPSLIQLIRQNCVSQVERNILVVSKLLYGGKVVKYMRDQAYPNVVVVTTVYHID